MSVPFSGGINYARLFRDPLKQVINVYPARRAAQPVTKQQVLTKRDEIQEQLIEILGLEMPKDAS